MKFVSDCLTGKDNLSSGQIVRFLNAAWAKSLLRSEEIGVRFH